MSIYRVSLEKTVLEHYLIEADSEDEARMIAQEGIFLQPESSDELAKSVVEVEELE